MGTKLKEKQAPRDSAREKHSGSSVNAIAGKRLAKHDKKKAAALKPSSDYQAVADDFDKRAAAHALKASEHDNLLARFGECLAKQKVGKLDAKASIVWDWDKNKDGKLSLAEFRMQVKGIGVGEADIKEIDALFSSFDKDSSGSLELAELKVAFKRAMVAAMEKEGKVGDVTKRAAQLTQVADEAREVVELTLEYETELAALSEMQASQGTNLEEKLGTLFAKKNTHVGDLKQWDENGDGEIDKAEFRSHVHSVGMKGIADEELDKLYDTLDSDGSGKLDMAEVKASLMKLQQSAAKAVGDLADEADLVADMERIVLKRQQLLDKTIANDKENETEGELLAVAEEPAPAPAVDVA